MKKEINKNIIQKYILPLFATLYLTYLITRLWDLNLIGIILINVTISIPIFLLTKKYCVKKCNTKISKIIFLSLLLSIITVLSFPKFFTAKFKDSSVIITGSNLSTKSIDYVIYNNQKYEIKDNQFLNIYDKWNNKFKIYTSNNDIKFVYVNNNKIKLSFLKGHNIKIFFNKEFKGNITELNKNTKIKSTNNVKIYELSSNSKFDKTSIFRCLLSITLLTYIYYKTILIYVNSKKSTKGLIIIIFVSIVVAVLYSNNLVLGYVTNDSDQYIRYSFKKLFHLKFDLKRMPLYPLIVRLSLLVFKKNYIEFICFFQYLLWIISTIYLYKLLLLLLKNIKFCIIATIFYILCPAVVSWNNVILTESIALSGTVIFIYYIIKYIKTKQKLCGIISILISFILTFIRPTSIIYLCLCFGFFILTIIFDENNRNTHLKCLKINAISLIIIILYVVNFYRCYGILSMNELVIQQDFIVTVLEDYYKTSDDEEYIAIIDKSLNGTNDNVWKSVENIKKRYTIKEISNHVKYTKRKNKQKYIKYLIRIVKDNATEKFYGYSYENTNPKLLWLHNAMYHSFSIITFLHIYIMIFVYLILTIKGWIKTKKIPLLFLGFFGFPFVIVISSFIGTCGEFMRTAITSMQFTYISIIYFIYLLFSKGESK